MATQRRMLVVDGDPWTRQVFEPLAQDLGYELHLAADGPGGVEAFAEHLPDVVVVDLAIRGIDGLELCRRIRATGPGAFTPIVAIGADVQGDPTGGEGVDAFLAKPLSPEFVVRRLRTLFATGLNPGADTPRLGPAETGEMDLPSQPLALVLARIFNQQLSGVLRVRTRLGRAEFLLRSGQIVQSRAPFWTETLGAALVRLRRIRPPQLARIEGPATVAGWRQIGDAAVRDGLLESGAAQKIWAALQMARVAEAFGWTEGYQRVVVAPVETSALDLPLDTAALVYWGVRRSELSEVALQLAMRSRVAPLVRQRSREDRLRTLPLTATEKWLLDRVDGEASFDDLVRETSPDALQLDLLMRAVVAFLSLGVVELGVRGTAAAKPPLREKRLRKLDGSPIELLLALWREEANGVLAFDLPKSRCLLYLHNGKLVASRESESEGLDSLLALRGRIRPDLVPRVRALVASGQNVGQALIDLRAIAAPQLQTFVRGELRAALGECVRVHRVAATFTEESLPERELAREEWDTGQAVVQTTRSLNMAHVRRLLPEPEAVVAVRPDPEGLAKSLPLAAGEKKLLDSLAEPMRWRKLEASEGTAPQDQQRALAMLLMLGLVEVSGRAQAPALKSDPEIPIRRSLGPSIPPLMPAVPEPSVPPRRRRDSLGLQDLGLEAVGETVPMDVHTSLRREKDVLAKENAALKEQVAALMAEVDRLTATEVHEETGIRMDLPFAAPAEEPAASPPEAEEGGVISFTRSRR